VSTVMIVTPGAENREELVNGVVVACRAAGSVSHIVALSMLTATREDMLVGGQFSRIEGMIATCGMDYTILRLPLLMESTLAHVRTVQREQKIRGSLAPCSTFVVVAAADVARAAATVLANPSAHTNKTYSLTGSVITMEMVAGAYSNASGLDVTYTQ
ncbi:LOC106164359, partial [Symbiodinium microadriaticum]